MGYYRDSNGTAHWDGNTGSSSSSGTSSAIDRAVTNTTRPDAQYVANQYGQITSQYTQGNATYNVLKDSVFDPLSKNYNALVANSNGKITLSDLDSSTANGLSPAYNGTPGSGATNSAGYANRVASNNTGNGGGATLASPTTPSLVSPTTFDPNAEFKKIQDDLNKQIADLTSQISNTNTANTNTANYNASNQSGLNSTALDNSNSTATNQYGAYNPSPKTSGGGAQIKSNAISKYLATDMWANKI